MLMAYADRDACILSTETTTLEGPYPPEFYTSTQTTGTAPRWGRKGTSASGDRRSPWV